MNEKQKFVYDTMAEVCYKILASTSKDDNITLADQMMGYALLWFAVEQATIHPGAFMDFLRSRDMVDEAGKAKIPDDLMEKAVQSCGA